MICNKCNQRLPEDSEFCQFCGARIEKPLTASAAEEKAEPAAVATPTALDPVPQKERSAVTPVPQTARPVKAKYCSRCGSLINSKTKKCTGCGKQYFRGLRFTKFSVTVIVLALVIALLSTVCVLQYFNIQEQDSANQLEIEALESKVSSLEQQVKDKESSIKLKEENIKRLKQEIDSLEQELLDYWIKLYS